MNLSGLVWINLKRNKLRTILTTGSVVVALFLFCALQGVLDTLEDSIEVGSETRLVTRNAISLVFPLPLSYNERLRTVDGVQDLSIVNWFGGLDPVDPGNFFAQFAVEAENYFSIYEDDLEIIAFDTTLARTLGPSQLGTPLDGFYSEQMACLVGKRLFERMDWKLGQTITLNGTIYPGEWPFTIRGVYRAKNPSFGEETLFFHFKYLYERTNQQALAGTYALQLSEPQRAAAIAREIDAMFENSTRATRTETERAFQAGFVSMYGNIPFLLGVIGTAVVFAILLVAANTMMMAVRERTAEIGVMKTLGFEDSTLFKLVLGEGAIITLGGGIVGALLAKFGIEASGFNGGGFLPPMTVHWSTVAMGIGIALVMGAASGLLPAWQVARLRVVDSLRRVD